MMMRRRTRIAARRTSAAQTAQSGFTILELLVVLGIITLLATIAGPQVLKYIGKARSETARAQISAISTALELYALDVGVFPPQQTGLTALMHAPQGTDRWRGPYLKNAQGLIDPWGRAYLYRLPGRGVVPDVYSLGRDNQPGGSGEDGDVSN